jgi:hypothetical protein
MEKDGNLATGHQRPLNNVLYINVREYRRRNQKMNNPEKLVQGIFFNNVVIKPEV